MNNNDVKSRQPSGDKLLMDYFPSRFLKPEDLLRWKVAQKVVKISRAVEEEVMPKPGEKEWKLVLYFQTKTGAEYPRGYLVSSKADINTLQAMGAERIADLKGMDVNIMLDEWRSKSVLRLGNPGVEYVVAEEAA